MNKTEAREINGALCAINMTDIVRSKLNPRQSVKADVKGSELFESIKRNGVQHPIEVRQIKTGKDGKKVQYELLSGERRLAICEELKHKTIPAIVYEKMNDAEAYEKTHFENIGREDLSPLEQAIDAQNLMKVYKDDVKAVASALGISEKSVKLRLQLKNLSPAWVKALKTPLSATESNAVTVHDLSIAHLELIARMGHGIQDELLGSQEHPISRLRTYNGIISVSNLRSLIASEYTMSLSEVPWKLDDELLLQEAGSCSKCARRSDSEVQRELWNMEEEDRKANGIVRCLDGACFRMKLSKWQDSAVEEARKQHQHLRVIGDDRAKAKYGELAVSPHEVVPAKKSEKGAFPVIVLDGMKKGISYARLRDNVQNNPESKDSGKTRTLNQRREQLKGLRIGIALKRLKETLDRGAMPVDGKWTVDLMAALVAVYGGTGPARTNDKCVGTIQALAGGEKVAAIKDWASKASEADLKTIIWWKLVKDLKNAMNDKNAVTALSCEEQGRWLAGLVGFDWDKAFAEACEQKKEPKSWLLLNEDGTPRTEKTPASDTETKKAAA